MFGALKAQLSTPVREILILQTLHIAVAQNSQHLIDSFHVASFPYALTVSIVNSIW